jgi:Leucine-rich repeat (LRR) protein
MRNLVIIFMVGAVSLYLFQGCNSSGSGQNELDPLIMEAEKPVLDTTMVLEILELYRAQRFEGIQPALGAGVENAHKMVLYGRKLGTLPPEIGKLKYLQTLDVAFNELVELPQELSELHYLQGFYANGNSLTEFPKQILLLPILAKIDLSENQISEIPREIKKMDQLTRLTIEENTLMSVPVEVYDLTNLTVLELAGNGLTKIPEGIASLNKLKKLDLSNNQLTALPREIASLTETLKDMAIQGNPIPDEEVRWLIDNMPGTKIRY